MQRKTFHGVPKSDDGRFEGRVSDVAILGVPLDSGVSHRSGARHGPRAIRCAPYLSGEVYSFAWQSEAFKFISVVDVGDIEVAEASHRQAIDAILRRARAIVPNTACLLSLGGDHSITFPLLQAVVDRYGPVDLVQLDAHTDTWRHDTSQLTHATVIRRAKEAGLIRKGSQIGIRGLGHSADILRWGSENSLHCWTMDDIQELGIDEVLHAVIERSDHPTYLTIDIDIVDPAFAPGTGTPEPGGLCSREFLRIIRILARGLKLVGCDVVEVSPPFDHAEITSILANRCVLELLAARAAQRAL